MAEYEEMKQLVANQVCAQCGGELTIRSNPENGNVEIWCPRNPDHHGYVERETYTQALRRGEDIHPAIRANIEKRMLPGGYPLGTALALIKTRFPSADLDDPSAALFVMDCMRLDLDPLLGEIIPVTFKVTNKETREVRKVVQPIITEDGWLSLAARACPDRWVGPPHTYRLEDYLRTLSENKDKAKDEIAELAADMKRDTCGDAGAYFWVAMGKVRVKEEIIETAPTYGWYRVSESKRRDRDGKEYELATPARELPGNQARVRAIKRWVRETFPEAKAKMKELTSEWLTRGKDIEAVQDIIAAEYHIVTEAADLKALKKGEGKIGEPAAGEQGEEEPGATVLTSPKQRQKSKKIETPAAATEAEGFHIDPVWLRETLKGLKWSEDTAKTFLASKYKVSPQGSLEEVIKRLTKEQAEEFVKTIQEKTAQTHMDLRE